MGCVAVGCGNNTVKQGVRAVVSFQVLHEENGAPFADLREFRVGITLRNRTAFKHYVWDGFNGGENISIDNDSFVTLNLNEGATEQMLGQYDIEGFIETTGRGAVIISRQFAIEVIPSLSPIIQGLL